MNSETIITICAIAISVAVIAGFAINMLANRHKESTVWQYQVGLHFNKGRLIEQLEPGRHVFFGKSHEVFTFDTRRQELVVQGQDLITADKATVKITAVLIYRIIDAEKMYGAASDPAQALYTATQLALREVIGTEEIDVFIENKATYGAALTKSVSVTAEALGLSVERVEIRDVILGRDLKSVYTGVLRARKEALAELEKARGEAAALRTLANASRVFEKNPALLQLRYMQSLEQITEGSHGNTIILGRPEDVSLPLKNP